MFSFLDRSQESLCLRIKYIPVFIYYRFLFCYRTHYVHLHLLLKGCVCNPWDSDISVHSSCSQKRVEQESNIQTKHTFKNAKADNTQGVNSSIFAKNIRFIAVQPQVLCWNLVFHADSFSRAILQYLGALPSVHLASIQCTVEFCCNHLRNQWGPTESDSYQPKTTLCS